MTRIAAFGSALLNIALMLIFGWMGHECLDEWTMAALGLAISVTVMFGGSGACSVDHFLSKDWLGEWFTPALEKCFILFSAAITVGFYSYYFGIFDFRKRTSTGPFAIVAQPVAEHADRITLYVKGGSSSSFAWVRGITFTLDNGEKHTVRPADIEVLRSHFEPWSHGAGKVVDGMMKLSLGSKVDIAVPANATGAELDLIGAKKPPQLTW